MNGSIHLRTMFTVDGLGERFFTFGSFAMKIHNRFFTFFFALLIVALAGCASTSEKRGTGAYIDDAAISTKVKAAIFNEPTLKSTQINVETYKGVVQLSGFVESQAHISRAVEVARSVDGVKSVKNNMALRQ